MTALATLRGITKTYGQKANQVIALNNLSVDIREGEFTAIMGPSGSGKSTFLHVLAGLDDVDSGTIFVAGREITRMKDRELTHFRREQIGFVFQSFNLIPTLSADDNILLPSRLARKRVEREKFNNVVHALGLDARLAHKPHELSGGQQQRVAIARALVASPALLVADEPTGNLDSSSSTEVLTMLRRASTELGQTVVMVTHDRHAAAYADRVLIVRDGQITRDLVHPSAEQIAQVA
ncbi:MAG: ABC transporter ATP-binding protein [Actinomycetaceae bacterium]|nr:ABC transporter ATP-binding protein [Actinomycetaceae bacterium]